MTTSSARVRRPFRFGAGVFTAESAKDLEVRARQIESLGYSTVAMPDHFDESLAPAVALMAVANATTSLRISTTVFDNDFRHPALLAKDVATLDLLSEGRFEFGLGAGWFKEEYDQVGIPFDPPSVRVSRLEEAIQIIKLLWTGRPVNFAGRYYTISGLVSYPMPAQRPHPPIFIGGGGRRMLSIAAREADIVGIVAQALPKGGLAIGKDDEDLLDTKVQWIREAAGSRLTQIELAILAWRVVVTDNGRGASQDVATQQGLTLEQVRSSPYFLIGSVNSIIEELVARRERQGVSYVSVFPEDVEAFAPVVAQLAGI
jgi:probable F420-dependent oxidoreductase